jgi:phosphate transport system substrate-binding protein
MRCASLLIGLVLCCATIFPAAGQQIHGSGSTFVYAALAKWSEAYQRTRGVCVEYQPIGSSAGLTEIRAGLVDFGVSDAPLTSDQLLRDGLAQFPVVIGAIVPVVNLDGITAGQLHFTGPLLANIYRGKVKNWSDPAVAAVNPGIRLPEQPILVIHRSDGSGTTFNWTDYLSKVSDEWKFNVGASTLVAWPTGADDKGNAGVGENVARVKGAIGYVEYGYAMRKRLAYGVVENRAGKFVPPNMSSFRAAAADIDLVTTREFYASLTDAASSDAYPIMAASFVLIHRYPKDRERNRDILAFFRWALENGQDIATSLDYLPLPPPLVQMVEDYWNAEYEPAITVDPAISGKGTRTPG